MVTPFILTDQTNQDRVQKMAADIVAADDVSQAVDLLKYLGQLLRLQRVAEQAPDVYAQYQALLPPVKWVALTAIPWNEVLALFKEQLVAGLRAEADGGFTVADKMKNRLRSELFIEERDRYRGQLRDALLNNNEVLTTLAIQHVDNQTVTPTVKHWLEEYVETFGAKPADELAYRDWLTKHLTFNKLPAAERTMVEGLFNLYEELKFSSLTPAGNEDVLFTSDVEGNLYEYREGGLEKVDPDGKIARLVDEEMTRMQTPVQPSVPTSQLAAPAPLVIAPSPATAVRSVVTRPPAPVPLSPRAAPAPAIIPREEIMRRYQGDPTESQTIAERQQQLLATNQRDSAKLTEQLGLLAKSKSP
ncbi:MAG: hypothetical protein AAB817_01660, partial [Patescibacteria group bacterium]